LAKHAYPLLLDFGADRNAFDHLKESRAPGTLHSGV
jgi:hypothetical protein